MRIEKYLFSFWVTMLSLPLYSQEVNIELLSQSNFSPIEYANIEFLNFEDKQLEVKTTDSLGIFSFMKSTNCHYIKISHISYRDTLILYKGLINNDSRSIVLKESEVLINEISISAERTQHEVRGDTTVYNLNHYKNNTDQNFGDVLNRLDGISVAQNGTISYNNDPIDKILIEGKDILNDQHKLTIESLAPKDISKVQIIDQYRPFHEQFIKKYSEKVAMNLILTEEAKQKINGDISAQAGIKNKYQALTNLYTANAQKGISGFIRSNNLGRQTITTNDFLNLQSSLIRTLIRTNGNIDDILPSAFLDKSGQQKDLDNLIALNFEQNFSPTKTIKISNLSNYTDRDISSDLSRLYFQSTTPLLGQESSSEKFLYNKSILNFKNLINDNSSMEIDLPMEIIDQNFNGQFSEIISSEFPNSQTLIKNISYSVFPQAYYNNQLKPNTTLKVESSVFYKYNSDEININSNENLFGTDSSLVIQGLQMYSINFRIKPELVYSKDEYRFGFSIPTEYYNNKIENSFIENGINRRLNASNSLNFTPQVRLGYKTEKIWIEPKVELNLVNANSTNFNTTDQFLNPSILTRYNFSRFKYLLLRWNIKNSIYNLENYYYLQEIIDNNTIRSYRTEELKNTQTSQSVTLSYVNINLSNKSRLKAILSYSSTKNGLYDVNLFQDNYFLQTRNVSDNTTNSSLIVNGEKRLSSGKLIIRPSLSLDCTKIETESSISLVSASFKVGLLTNTQKLFNTDVSISFNSDSQEFNNVKNNFHSFKFEHGFNIKKEQLLFHLNGDYNLRIGEGTESSFYIANFEFDYIINKKWSIIIEGNDILNLNSHEIQNFQSTSTYIQTNSFRRFPGSIVFGAKMIL